MMEDSQGGKTFIYQKSRKVNCLPRYQNRQRIRVVYAPTIKTGNAATSHPSSKCLYELPFVGINAGIKFFTSVIHHKILHLRYSL